MPKISIYIVFSLFVCECYFLFAWMIEWICLLAIHISHLILLFFALLNNIQKKKNEKKLWIYEWLKNVFFHHFISFLCQPWWLLYFNNKWWHSLSFTYDVKTSKGLCLCEGNIWKRRKKSDFLLYQISCYDSSLILFFSMLMNWYCQCCVRSAYKLIYYFWTKKYSEKRENHFTISILYWCFFSNIMQVCMWKWSCQTHRRIWWPRKFVSLCFFFFPF